MLNGDITWVHSDLDDFRFVAGTAMPTLENTYQANVSSGATSVQFDVGGQSVVDSNPGDGWSALFDMSASTSVSELTVQSFSGATLLDTYVHDVDLLMLPNWMLDPDVVIDSISADPVTGYAFDVYAKDVDFAVVTPDDWSWGLEFDTDQFYFDQPILDIANLRTGFDAGWQLSIQSTSYGGVYVTGSSYHLNLEVLGEEIWSHTIETGTSGTLQDLISSKSKKDTKPKSINVTGNYSVALSPQLTESLQWVDGLSGSAHLDVQLSKQVHLPPISLANANGLPSWLVDVQIKPFFNIGAGLSIDTNLGFDSSGIHLNTLNVTPSIIVGVGASGEVNAGGGDLAEAGITLTGTVEQNLSMTYLPGSGWAFAAPGSLNVAGSLYWDTFLTEPGGKDLFDVDIASWDFLPLTPPPAPELNTNPDSYMAPTVTNNTPSSSDPVAPTLRTGTFDIDASAGHPSGIVTYGYLLEHKQPDQSWRFVENRFSANPNFQVGPLGDGSYRLQTIAYNAFGGVGYGQYEYFFMDNPIQLGSDVSIVDMEWEESPSGNAKKDDDWIAESGEDVGLLLELENQANEEIRNIWAYLSTPDGTVRITNNDNFFDRLDPSESSWGSDSFRMSLRLPSEYQNLPFTLYVEYLKGSNDYYQVFEFDDDVPADGQLEVDFEFAGVQIDDSPQYNSRNNGDGVFQSGEKIRIRPLLKNSGNVAAQNIEVEVTSLTNSLVYFETGDLEVYPDLNAGVQAYPNPGEFFQIESVDKTFTGDLPVDLRVSWAGGNRYLYLPSALTLTVEPAANLHVSPDTGSLGHLEPGESGQISFEVQNRGSEPLIVTDIVTATSNVSFSDTSFVVDVAAARAVTLTYDATVVPDGTRIAEQIQVITSNGRVSDPGVDDVFILTGIVSDSVTIGSLPTTVGHIHEPDISSDWIVWKEFRNSQYDVFAYNLTRAEEIQLTNDLANQDSPFISGSLIIWEDGRHQVDASDRTEDIYAYDLNQPQLGVFPMALSANDQDLIGLDNGLVAVAEVYEQLYKSDGALDEEPRNLLIYQYDGNGSFSQTYSTGWVPLGAGNYSTRSSVSPGQSGGDFNEGLLVFKQWDLAREFQNDGDWSWALQGHHVRKLDLTAGDTTPQVVGVASESTRYAASTHRIAFNDKYSTTPFGDTNEVFLWNNGSISQLTLPVEMADKGDDALAIYGDFIIYDYDTNLFNDLFYYDLSDNSERFILSDLNAGLLRMDSNGAVWEDRDETDKVFYAFLQEADLSISSLDIVLTQGDVVLNGSIDFSVLVHNVSSYNYAGDLTLRAYVGDPMAGGMLAAENPLTGVNLTGGAGLNMNLTGIALNSLNGVTTTGPHDLYFTLEADGYDQPTNNQVIRTLFVQGEGDDDIVGPSITDINIAEFLGDGDLIIGSDENAVFSWQVGDPSGISNVDVFVDGIELEHENSSVVVSSLSAGTHAYLIRALDGDDSPALNEVAGSFQVVEAEEIVITYDGASVTDDSGATPFALPDDAVGLPFTQHTFSISNSGNQALFLSELSVTGPWEISNNLTTSTVAAGQSTTFTIQLASDAVAGEQLGIVTLSNSDQDESPFQFGVSATLGVPLLDVTDDTFLADDNLLRFWENDINDPTTHSFTIDNSGNGLLRLTDISVSNSHQVQLQIEFRDSIGGLLDDSTPIDVPVGDFVTINVEFASSDYEQYLSEITFSTNDPLQLESTLLIDARAKPTYFVNSTADVIAPDGLLTLREALEAANTNTAVNEAVAGSSISVDTISFADNVLGNAILLQSSGLRIADDVAIDGRSGITIDGSLLTETLRSNDNSGTSWLSNLAFSGGGTGIWVGRDSTAYLTSVTVEDHGNGLFFDLRATAYVSGSYLVGNYKGIFASRDSDAFIYDTAILNNSGSQGGGLRINEDAYVEMHNTLIAGNHSSNTGGGISNDGEVFIWNSTITDNTAQYGGGIFYSSDSKKTRLFNSILAGNTATVQGNDIDKSSSALNLADGDYNLIGITDDTNAASKLVSGGANSIWGTSTTPLDPQFGPLLQSANGRYFYPLLAGSPAINDGGNAFVTGSSYDIRGEGFDRIYDGVVDMGAYEFQPDGGLPVIDSLAVYDATPPGDLQRKLVFWWHSSDNSGVLKHEFRVDGGAWTETSDYYALIPVSDTALTFEVHSLDVTEQVGLSHTLAVDPTLVTQPLVDAGQSLTVPEGSSGVFVINLVDMPALPISLDLVHQSGSEDVSFDPSGVTFTSGDWNMALPISISVGEDTDVLDDEAVIAVELDGLAIYSFMVTVQDNDRSNADFDLDGLVTGLDFLAWQRGFGTLMPIATKSEGDADNDLDVDGDDLTVWKNQFGNSANQSSVISIEKSTNGQDADTPTGPTITVGDSVSWTYVVTNAGNVDLMNIVVTDDQGVVPVRQPDQVGNNNSVLEVGEVWVYEATGTATTGQYANLGTVMAEDPLLQQVSDSDLSHYLGVDSAPVTFEWATIGNAGNGNDLTGYGGVANDYRISKYEVTVSQYTQFLNAVAASDSNGLYNGIMPIMRTGSDGSFVYAPDTGLENRPIAYVSWLDTLRFTNWLHNGQPNGSQDASTTEDGAYDMSLSSSNIIRKAVASVFLPSEHEWYKAAYHHNDDVTANYWDYPTGSDGIPDGIDFAGDTTFDAVYDDGDSNTMPNEVTDAGIASPYGTVGQGGNVWEWNEAKVLRGGAYDGYSQPVPEHLHVDTRLTSYSATSEAFNFGFRVARTSSALMAVATAQAGPAVESESSDSIQLSVASSLPLSADLVDAAIAVDFASRSRNEPLSEYSAPLTEDQFDWISHSTKWYQQPNWQGSSEIANRTTLGLFSKDSDDRFYRNADNSTVTEELLDELFADGEFSSLL